MAKTQISRLLICSCVVFSISLAQQNSKGSSATNNVLGNQRIVPPQLQSALVRRTPATNSIARAPSADNQSATAELTEQKQTQGAGSPAETPQGVPGFGLQQQFPSYARPGPPYFGFNFGSPSANPQQLGSAAQPGAPQSSQPIQPRASPFFPNGYTGFNFQTTGDLFSRFSPASGTRAVSSPSSSSASSEAGVSSGNATPSAQSQNFGANFGGGFPFASGIGQGFPQNAFPSSGFGGLGQGSPATGSLDEGSQKPVVGFYGGGAPNIGSYSFTGGSQQEQQFQPQFQNSFQASGFGASAGFGQFPSGAGLDSFGQFGFGPSGGGLAGSPGLGSGDVQNTQSPQQILNQS